MQKKAAKKETPTSLETIVEAARSRKANDILSIDINKQSTTLCRHFVICDAASHVQVQAIAEAVLDQMNEQKGEKAAHREGFQNGIWILLDYVDIVVHIFQTESRQFYNLEELWGDGIFTRFES